MFQLVNPVSPCETCLVGYEVTVLPSGIVYLSMIVQMSMTRIEPNPPPQPCVPTLEAGLEKARNLQYLGDRHLLELLAQTSAFTPGGGQLATRYGLPPQRSTRIAIQRYRRESNCSSSGSESALTDA